jgi:hypothetical protein
MQFFCLKPGCGGRCWGKLLPGDLPENMRVCWICGERYIRHFLGDKEVALVPEDPLLRVALERRRMVG